MAWTISRSYTRYLVLSWRIDHRSKLMTSDMLPTYLWFVVFLSVTRRRQSLKTDGGGTRLQYHNDRHNNNIVAISDVLQSAVTSQSRSRRRQST